MGCGAGTQARFIRINLMITFDQKPKGMKEEDWKAVKAQAKIAARHAKYSFLSKELAKTQDSDDSHLVEAKRRADSAKSKLAQG